MLWHRDVPVYKHLVRACAVKVLRREKFDLRI